MQFEILKIKDLNEFILSKQFRKSKVLPITSHRALSQINNPRSEPNDVSLIIAKDKDDNIIGYIGLLPDRLNEIGQTASWLSCWWTDDRDGKKAALHLFLMAIKVSNSNFIITDFTPDIKTIAEKSKLFQFIPTYYGVRGFMGFDLHEIFLRKYKWLKSAQWILAIKDRVLNFLIRPINFYYQLKFNDKNLIVEELQHVDNEASEFISQHNENEYFKRGEEEINWMINYPWILHDDKKEEAKRYYFSAKAKIFRYHLLKIKEHNKIIAFVVLRQRNHSFTTPFIYSKLGNEQKCLNVIYSFLLKKKARQFTIFHPHFVKFVKTASSPFFYKRNIPKDFAISQSIIMNYDEQKFLQDGDGDYAFT